MDEILFYTELFDVYKKLLTDKQRTFFQDYYFENLTIEEIAENYKISKNAVSKTLKSVKVILNEYEQKLNVKKYMQEIKREFKNEDDILNRIMKYDNIIL